MTDFTTLTRIETRAAKAPALIERVKTITTNARTTWFGFLAAAAFAAITLSAVKDIDFFSADASTQLPFINIAVPTPAFFLAGAFLITIVYAYLHVFLEKLWRAIGQLPARHENEPIANAIHPWIVSDFALTLRRLFRPLERSDPKGENGLAIEGHETTPIALSPLWLAGGTASFALCWLTGPLLTGWFWLRSMPAHDLTMTIWTGLFAAISTAVMFASLAALWRHMGPPKPRKTTLWPPFILTAILMLITLPISHLRTVDDWLALPIERDTGRQPLPLRHPWLRPLTDRLIGFAPAKTSDATSTKSGRVKIWQARTRANRNAATRSNCANTLFPRSTICLANALRPVPADLAETTLTELPEDWTTSDIARKDMFAKWCARPDTPNCKTDLSAEERTAQMMERNSSNAGPFAKEFAERRATYLRVLNKPILRGRDLSKANLSQAHLPGMDIGEALMEGADLSGAQMEGADLKGTQMEGADLSGAQMEGANLKGAQMEGLVARCADLQRLLGDCVPTNFRGANLTGAHLANTDLAGAEMQNIRAGCHRLELIIGACAVTNFSGADLSDAKMEGADLLEARMEGTNLAGAQMKGVVLTAAKMTGANLLRARLQGANVSGVKMEGVDLSEALLSGAPNTTNRISSIKASANNGGALRYVDLRIAISDGQFQWTNSFADGSVQFPDTMPRPCQWISELLSDEEFFAHWHGWLLRGGAKSNVFEWLPSVPEEFRSIPPKDPWPDDCQWK